MIDHADIKQNHVFMGNIGCLCMNTCIHILMLGEWVILSKSRTITRSLSSAQAVREERICTGYRRE
jgi:hypothetical protein